LEGQTVSQHEIKEKLGGGAPENESSSNVNSPITSLSNLIKYHE
jgi:hypothetical protein